MTEISVVHGGWLGLDWQAVSATATLVLAVGAALAAWQVNRQIRQAAKHHDEQIRALLRPMLVVTADTLRLGRPPLFPPVDNVGVGPALSVKGKAWLMGVPPAPAGMPAPVARAAIDRAADDMRGRPHHLDMSVSAVAAGGQTKEWLPRDDGQPPQLAEGDAFVMVYELEYEDVEHHHYQSSSNATGRVDV